MALKRQRPEVREKEAQAMALKRQRPEVREREAQAVALKRQRPEVRKEKHMQRSRAVSSRALFPLTTWLINHLRALARVKV